MLTAFAAVLTALAARDAAAFCRTTTCNPKLATCDVDENGCTRTGAPLSWRALPLVYRFHGGGSEKLDMDRSREAIRRAFQTWSNVTCRGKRTSLHFEEGSDIPGSHPLTTTGPAKTPFGIYFRDQDWPYDEGEESLALTNQTFGTINGYIDYSGIEINATSREFALADDEKGIDLQAVITHEVGHYIGLAHSRVPDSIMVASYCESGDRCGTSVDRARALANDDVTAVCALYPPSGIAGVAYVPPPESCALGGASFARATRARSAWHAAVALALLLLRRARRREGRARDASR